MQAWVTELGKRRFPDVVAKCAQLTGTVLRSAVSNRLLAFNPCEDIRLPPRRKHDSDERIITREELVTVLLPAMPDQYRAIVAIAGGAGLRCGEAAGLCADALDLDQRRLRVIRTRTIPLPPWLVEIIKEHRKSSPWARAV